MLLSDLRNWRQLFVAAAAALFMTPSLAAAQTHDPAAFDIVGIRLGMMPEQVLQALQAAGYGPKYNRKTWDLDIDRGPSFAADAHSAAESQLGIHLPNPPKTTAISGITSQAANGSEVVVTFLDWSDGPRAAFVIYRGGQAMRDRADEIDAHVRSKYGAPTQTVSKATMAIDYWCSPGVTKCNDDAGSRKPRLSMERFTTGGRTLLLSIGGNEERRRHALKEAEGAKIAAAMVKAGQGPVTVKAGSAADAARRDPASFDVAGVKLGMTTEQATAILTAAGYRPSAKSPPRYDLTFEQRVQLEVDRRNGRNPDLPKGQGVQGLTFEHPNGAQVDLFFINPAEGSRIESVMYQIPVDRLDYATFRQRIDAKYGQPTASRITGDLWCAKTSTECRENNVNLINEPHLLATRMAGNGNYLRVALNNGTAAGDKLYKAVEAEVFRRTGKY